MHALCIFKREQPVRLTLLEITFFFCHLSNFCMLVMFVTPFKFCMLVMFVSLLVASNLLNFCYEMLHKDVKLFILIILMIMMEFTLFLLSADCLHLSKHVKTCQTLSKLGKFWEKNLSKLMKTMGKSGETWRNLKTCQNLTKFVKTCQNFCWFLISTKIIYQNSFNLWNNIEFLKNF